MDIDSITGNCSHEAFLLANLLVLPTVLSVAKALYYSKGPLAQRHGQGPVSETSLSLPSFPSPVVVTIL